MKKLIAKLTCWINGGHKLKVYRPVTDDVREVECTVCSLKLVVIDSIGRLVPLTPELQQFHDEIILDDVIMGR